MDPPAETESADAFLCSCFVVLTLERSRLHQSKSVDGIQLERLR